MKSQREGITNNFAEIQHDEPARGDTDDRLPALFIGIGNSLRGDDAAGLCAARELHRLGFPAIETAQLAPELAEEVSRASLVVFLDASLELRPGEVRSTAVCESAPSLFDHDFDPGSLLHVTHLVHGQIPRSLLLEVGIESCELGEGLTPSVNRGVWEMVERCQTLCSGRPWNYNTS